MQAHISNLGIFTESLDRFTLQSLCFTVTRANGGWIGNMLGNQ